jgi:ribose/xylose/arabinose/galactoside ABC-type transport system permease subunit
MKRAEDQKEIMLEKGTAPRGLVRRAGSEAGIGLVVIVIFVFLSIATKGFFTWDNLMIVARQISLTAVIAFGMTFVIIMAGIDLSVGSVVALTSVVTGMLIVEMKLPFGWGIIGGLAVGVLVGLFNGTVIIRTGVPPFIVTLGMMGIARGLALVITKGSSVSGLPNGFLFLGQGRIATIPVPVIIVAIVGVIASIILKNTVFGRHIYFIGSNEKAARLSGIKVDRIKLLVFVIVALLSSVEAIMETARLNTAQPATGVGYELQAIGAVIIGGASLFGGEGTILGTVLGTILLGLITNGLILLGVSAYWQQVFSGAIIILAVTLDVLRKR